jgi:UDP-MurNAc hydroxylase
MEYPQLEFINHASVNISNGETSVLSDPWYQGDSFHKGWNLLCELEDSQIESLLHRISHIWVSHEHPDHFSIGFFKKFKNIIIQNKIIVLFQDTDDKRVESFLKASKFQLIILQRNQWISLGKDFEVLNFKDGFYDSGLAIRTCNKTFLNLNDCEITTQARCKEIQNIIGNCDVLLSQFSYAAWKGGESNLAWRRDAAKKKLETLKIQVDSFSPQYLVPFASYIYFSNEKNFYLNDSSNTPKDVSNYFAASGEITIKIMRPFEKFFPLLEPTSSDESTLFWEQKFQLVNLQNLNKYISTDLECLNESFQKYRDRVFANNSKSFIWLVKTFSPVKFFGPLIIHLEDLNKTLRLNLFEEKLVVTNSPAHITMSSESLNFIFLNTFGFDTLTVNGCFEESSKNGFSRMTRLLAIENLNNLGIAFKPSIIFNIKLIILFLSRLYTVSRKLIPS